jgi:hypothetical protein
MFDLEREEQIGRDERESRSSSTTEDHSEERLAQSRRDPQGRRFLAPSKADLLAKACDREPKMFHKIDGWIANDPCDSCSYSDFHFTRAVTYQLMGGADVRVLIRPNLDCNARLRLLQQVLEHEREVPWEDLEKNTARTGSRRKRRSPAPQTPSKGELLAKLCDRQPTKFHQIDAWTKDPFGGLLPSEIDDQITATVTHELMNGADLRVLIRPDLDRATRFELIQRVLEFERRFDWEEYEGDLFARPEPCPDVDQETESDQDRHHEGTERSERLTDRLSRTTSFDESHREWFRVQALSEPRPDYGTFLKDQELIELFPEAAEIYHVDDIRRALMMIRMILDYGENAFTDCDGLAVYDLLSCILEQENFLFDGTWSANNPAARKRDARVRPTFMPGLEFDDEDDDDLNLEDDEEPLERPQRPQTPANCEYRVPECFEDDSLTVRTCVPDAERRLEHLVSMLESNEFRYYTSCSIQPEELQVVRNVGAWLLGIDPTYYTTERVLNALASVWALVRAHDRQVDRAPGEAD